MILIFFCLSLFLSSLSLSFVSLSLFLSFLSLSFFRFSLFLSFLSFFLSFLSFFLSFLSLFRLSLSLSFVSLSLFLSSLSLSFFRSLSLSFVSLSFFRLSLAINRTSDIIFVSKTSTSIITTGSKRPVLKWISFLFCSQQPPLSFSLAPPYLAGWQSIHSSVRYRRGSLAQYWIVF
ncbi:unnamed protein product [Acanthosepion pharaonis]|uniref:Uncharacterized protein n=1 Tax=Acanthosepion pharaonis TaxID=158019 RepID=A0A812DGS6_ACAPH|nr:unnamed protein product [Sepia pharaonis]